MGSSFDNRSREEAGDSFEQSTAQPTADVTLREKRALAALARTGGPKTLAQAAWLIESLRDG